MSQKNDKTRQTGAEQNKTAGRGRGPWQTLWASLRSLRLSYCMMSLLGSAVLAFGLYHVHAVSRVTEGGVLGATLLLEHLLSLSPAISGFLLNALCYLLGWRMLGTPFLLYSALSAGGFSVFYALVERMDPLWPSLAYMPLAAALIGGIFVGVGAGLCVRAGGASSGDDALAMALSHRLHCKIEYIYLASDLLVLALSLCYIPVGRILYSVLTVLLSGRIIGVIQRLPAWEKKEKKAVKDK